jgi:hypothetical protein
MSSLRQLFEKAGKVVADVVPQPELPSNYATTGVLESGIDRLKAGAEESVSRGAARGAQAVAQAADLSPEAQQTAAQAGAMIPSVVSMMMPGPKSAAVAKPGLGKVIVVGDKVDPYQANMKINEFLEQAKKKGVDAATAGRAAAGDPDAIKAATAKGFSTARLRGIGNVMKNTDLGVVKQLRTKLGQD